MRVAITGATGLIGRRLVAALVQQGDEVTALSRDPARAQSTLGVRTVGWDNTAGPAPADALSGQDGVVHLAGEPIAQRWSAGAKERIKTSRLVGTANLVAGLRAAQPRPEVLVSTSAAGYYGNRGPEPLAESASRGPDDDFLASVCVAWERAAALASEFGIRVVTIRNGVVLDRSGGALKQMLPPFQAFVGGPIAGGGQYISWITLDDIAGLYVAALRGSDAWTGPVNGCAPEPVTNAVFSRALGRALHRPAVLPVPALALRALYGEMASVVLNSQRMVPARATELGYDFRHADLEEALREALR